MLRATEVHRGPWFVAAKDVAGNVLLVTTNSVSAAATSSSSSSSSSLSGGSGLVGSSAGSDGGGGARFSVEDVVWVSGSPPDALQPLQGSTSTSGGEFEAIVQVRHGPASHAGVLSLKSDNSEGLDVQLEETAGGLAAGQYAAFYDPGNGICLGSGVISENKATWMQPSPPEGVGVLRKS